MRLRSKRGSIAGSKTAILAKAAAIDQPRQRLWPRLIWHMALAHLARSENWCRPNVDNSRAFDITGGRHPVVEKPCAPVGRQFVANDCDLGAENRRDLVAHRPEHGR